MKLPSLSLNILGKYDVTGAGPSYRDLVPGWLVEILFCDVITGPYSRLVSRNCDVTAGSSSWLVIRITFGDVIPEPSSWMASRNSDVAPGSWSWMVNQDTLLLRHSGILVLDWSVEIKRIAAYPKSLFFSLVIADVIFSVGQYSYSLVTSFRIFGGPVPTPGIFFPLSRLVILKYFRWFHF